MMNICGIDVSKDKLDVVIAKNETYLKAKTYGNDTKGHQAMVSLLKEHKISHVGMEATGYYHLDLAIALQATADIEVMVINPRSIHNFAKALNINNKNDALDAKLITQFIKRMRFSPWIPPSKSAFELRACGRYLVDLTKQRTVMKNQLHGYGVTKQMCQLVLDDLAERIELIDARITKIEAYTVSLINADEALNQKYALLTSITGVGTKTAIKVMGEVGVLSPDMKGKQWVAHAGLYPRQRQSGSSLDKSGGIGQNGNTYIREALYMSALSATRHDPYIKAYYQHLVNDNGLKKIQAVCAVMRKMLLAMHGMLKENKVFDNSRFYPALGS